ncbi:MAG: uncharacterized protein V7606_2094 [Burkholderiales bacterium]|jgi:hypothetical protein
MPPAAEPGSFQAQFHRRWNHLNDPHVRALAWLLDAPDLLDGNAPQWRGRIATLGPVGPETLEWLNALDRAPESLNAYLGAQPYTRLGRYAEKLMAFYFTHQETLVAHGLQVRAAKNDTIGEFDFLLRQEGELVHWEFASKFYLLETSGGGTEADDFVGPNLADTLGAKVRKIMERQLSLSQHPAAQALLPEPITVARALVKGWLFYYGQTPVVHSMGVSSPHCRGFWCTVEELGGMAAEQYMILPRLSWLAPAKATEEDCLSRQNLEAILAARFEKDSMPVMVAIVEAQGDCVLEVDRGFIVPDDWPSRAGARITHMVRAT